MKANCVIKNYPSGLLKVKKLKFEFDTGGKSKNGIDDRNLYDGVLDTFKYSVRKAIYQEWSEEHKLDKAKEYFIKTKEKINDIAFSNDWNYFITLTFSSKKCDRYSFEETSKKVRKFMNNYKRLHDENLKYLIIHETHKDGAYHYHGLIYLSNEEQLKDSGKRDGKNRTIYNWSSWKNGFSTVTKIDNLDACRYYVLKYIEKDMDKDYVKGQRRFYYSQNCEKPSITTCLDFDVTGMELAYESEVSIGYESVRKYDDMLELFDGFIEID